VVAHRLRVRVVLAVVALSLLGAPAAASAAETHQYTLNGYSGGFGTSASSRVHLQLASVWLPTGSYVDSWVAGHVVYGNTSWSTYWTCNGSIMPGTLQTAGTRQIVINGGATTGGAIGPVTSSASCSLWFDVEGYGEITSTTLYVTQVVEATAPPPPLPSPPPTSSPDPSASPSPDPSATPELCPVPLPSGQYGPPNMEPCPSPTPPPVTLSVTSCPSGWTNIHSLDGTASSWVAVTGRYVYVTALAWDIAWAGTSAWTPALAVSGGSTYGLFGLASTGAGTSSAATWSYPFGLTVPGGNFNGASGSDLWVWGSTRAGHVDTGATGSHNLRVQGPFTYSGYQTGICVVGSDEPPESFAVADPDPSASPDPSGPSPTYCTGPVPSGFIGPPPPTACPDSTAGPYGTLPPGMTPRPGTGTGTVPGIGNLPGVGGNGAPFPGFGTPFGDCAAAYPKPGQVAYWPANPPAFPGLTLDIGVYAGLVVGWLSAGVAVVVNALLFLWNGVIDLLIPSSCLGDALEAFIDDARERAPFAYADQALAAFGAGGEGMAGPAPDLSFDLMGSSITIPLDDFLGQASSIRPVLVVAMLWLIALGLWHRVQGAVGMTPRSGGGADGD